MQNRLVVLELCSSSTRMYASSEQKCIRDARDVIDWKELLEEFDHYQNSMRYHKSIIRLAIRDMATLGFLNSRTTFHKHSEDEICRCMDTKKSEKKQIQRCSRYMYLTSGTNIQTSLHSLSQQLQTVQEDASNN